MISRWNRRRAMRVYGVVSRAVSTTLTKIKTNAPGGGLDKNITAVLTVTLTGRFFHRLPHIRTERSRFCFFNGKDYYGSGTDMIINRRLVVVRKENQALRFIFIWRSP